MRWDKGFTLIELLVAMAIAGVVMAGIYSAYSSQQRSYIVQEQVAGMQQNLRASMDLMEREIRMAGCDPTGGAGAKIIKADIAELQFTIDLNEDGDVSSSTGNPNEQIRYKLTDSGGLGREIWSGGLQPVAENIDALNFVYLDQRLSDGIDNDGDGTIDEYDEAVMATPVVNTGNIRSIQITMIARSSRVDRRYTDTDVYMNQQTTVIFGPKNDHFRRKLLTAQVCCRNLAF
jgi:type IV pilus assembly protein PilW